MMLSVSLNYNNNVLCASTNIMHHKMDYLTTNLIVMRKTDKTD